MRKFASTIWSLRASLAFLLVVSTATGFLLGAYARPMFQVSVEGGQVLAARSLGHRTWEKARGRRRT